MPALDLALARFQKSFHSSPQFIVRSPGRVNLLGEHVDYNDGWVLPVAIDRATYLAARKRDDDQLSIFAADLDSHIQLQTSNFKSQISNLESQTWALYPAGVAHILREANLNVTGIDCAFASDVPRGAGLSSSASVELAFAIAWQKLGGWSLGKMELAQLCQKAENEFVGVNCGIMDQFACANGKEDHALLLDCRSLEWTPVPLPQGVAVVIADTTKRRELGKSEYNNRRAACEEASRLLGVKALRDISLEEFTKRAHTLPSLIAKRARHVVEECDRTLKAVESLKRNDVESFGYAMNESHRTLRDLYEVSCPELDAMVSAAQSLEGCYGARLTGAGFGGCAVALVNANAAQNFERELAKRYEKVTGLKAEIYVCKASNGTNILS
ncbi:MAG: galactokinase [Chloroflexota bacterium]